MDVTSSPSCLLLDCKITDGRLGTATCIFRSMSDVLTHERASLAFPLHPSRLLHRLPLDYLVPCAFTLPCTSTRGTFISSSALLYYKLLQIRRDLECAIVIDNHLRSQVVPRRDFDFARHCVCDVLFLDDNFTISEYCNWKSSTGDDAALLVAPSVCNADAFLMHANLDRDDAGLPIFYKQPLEVPRFKHLPNETALLEPWLLALARHRINWIADRGLLDYALQLVECTGLSLREVLQSGATAFADAIIEKTWMQNALSLPKLERSVGGESDSHELLEGGTVLDALLGCHRGLVVMFDASSLYPSVVRQFNLDRLLCIAFTALIEARAAATTAMRNRALKLLSNSIFGSRLFGKYRNPQLAAAITAHGRLVLERAQQIVRAHNSGACVIVAGDTDGLAVKCTTEADVDALLQQLNAEWHCIRFKVDRRLSVLVQLTKKTWFGCDAGSGQRISKGTEDIKSGTCYFAKTIHELWQSGVLEGAQFDLDAFLEGARRRLEAAPLVEVICHPKPTKTHKNINRAFVYCTVALGSGRYGNEEVPLARFLDVYEPQEYRLDLDKLFKIQISDPIKRYAASLTKAVDQLEQ
jgi:hypothetical protein